MNYAKLRRNLRVLVPGAGLGRLAWDVANLGMGSSYRIDKDNVSFSSTAGFACQGNEFSHYMLLASFFVLNRYASMLSLSRITSFTLPQGPTGSKIGRAHV